MAASLLRGLTISSAEVYSIELRLSSLDRRAASKTAAIATGLQKHTGSPAASAPLPLSPEG
jgi:hypothetical protein